MTGEDRGEVATNTFVEWITTADAATILRVTQRRVRQLIAEGELEARRVSPNLWMVKRSSVYRYDRQR